MPSKNRVPLAVKIARKVLNDLLSRLQMVRDIDIIFEDNFTYALYRELQDLRPETLGRIIAHGESDIDKMRASMLDGMDERNLTKSGSELYTRQSGMCRLHIDARSVIRAAMIDLIKENNARLTKVA